MASTIQDIISDALIEIGAVAPGEALQAGDAAVGLRKANALLDEWAARRVYAYNVGFAAYTLTPNLSPHTIGPGGTFSVTQRPVRIEGASLILNTSTPNVDLPMNIRDDDWWNYQRVKSLTSNVPTDLYYSPDFPLGSLYFWPVPNFAYGVRLETYGILGQFSSLVASFSFPPAFQNAFMLSLAESLTDPYERPLTPSLSMRATRARKAYEGNNDASPRMSTAEGGQGSSRPRADFNYISGLPSSFGGK